MEKIETKREVIDQRKSEKYKSFPGVDLGWGKDMRESHPDQLRDGIMGRIRHISARIDSYLPPLVAFGGGDNQYKVDQTIAVEIENSFDELAQLYLECAKEGRGGTIFPLDENNHSYPFDTIQAIDLKLEEIQALIINAEDPLFKEKNSKDMKDEEKNALHEQGINMLKEALVKIKSLKDKLESKSILTA